MMTPVELKQLRAFARQDGAILFLTWAASFLCIVFLPETPLGVLLMLATPFVVGWRLSQFRRLALDNRISFGRAFYYCLQVFLYASVLFALGQYVYFQYIDGGRFYDMVSSQLDVLMPIYEQNGISSTELKGALEQLGSLSAIQLAFTFMMQNLFIGLILSPLIALVGRKR